MSRVDPEAVLKAQIKKVEDEVRVLQALVNGIKQYITRLEVQSKEFDRNL